MKRPLLYYGHFETATPTNIYIAIFENGSWEGGYPSHSHADGKWVGGFSKISVLALKWEGGSRRPALSRRPRARADFATNLANTLVATSIGGGANLFIARAQRAGKNDRRFRSIFDRKLRVSRGRSGIAPRPPFKLPRMGNGRGGPRRWLENGKWVGGSPFHSAQMGFGWGGIDVRGGGCFKVTIVLQIH